MHTPLTAIAELMHRALTYQNEQNFEMAETLYRQVLEHQPSNVDALHFLGLILYIKKDDASKQEGLKLVDKSIALSPNNQEFVFKRSLLYIDCRDWIHAEKLCTQLITTLPAFSGGYFNLANVYASSGRLDAAEAIILKAIKLEPQKAVSHALLGLILFQKKRIVDAGAAYQSAVEKDSQCYDAVAGLGNVLALQHKHADARPLFEHAISLRPEIADNYSQLAAGYILGGNFAAARALLEQGLARDATNDGCLGNLMQVYAALGHRNQANRLIEKRRQSGPLSDATYRLLLHFKNFDPTITAADLFALHCEYGAHIEASYKVFWPKFKRELSTERPLKIGYVSGDFRTHVVANFIAPILKNHDHDRYKIVCYSNSHIDDDTTKELKASVNEWHTIINMPDEVVVAMIREHAIDILVDLSGHTYGNILHLFAQKLAPIQITWIGYPGTTGLSAMDYRITSADLDPVGVTDQFHTEMLLRLPFFSASFAPSLLSPSVNHLPALKNGHMTFASLNVIQKINERVAACWATILKQLPNAKLLICDAGDSETAAWVTALFTSLDVPAHQLILKPRMRLAEFLNLLLEVDVALDPFPYNGGTTTSHACWAGVPTITWPGDTTPSNVGSAILRPLGLETFVVSSESAYIAKAVALANDLPMLAAVRASLRERMLNAKGVSPLEITREVETLYRTVWRTWCESEAT